jgi:hypothetical protein
LDDDDRKYTIALCKRLLRSRDELRDWGRHSAATFGASTSSYTFKEPQCVAGFSYLGCERVLAIFASVATFIVAYIYCIATYGFLFGLGLGWLPSAILAGLVGLATVFLWGPALILIVAGIVVFLNK